MYAHFYREAQRELPELTFKDDEEVQTSKSERRAVAGLLADQYKRIS